MNLPVDFQRVVPVAVIGIVAVMAGFMVARGLGGGDTAGTGPAQVLDQTFGGTSKGSGASSGKFEATGTVALQGAPSAAANPVAIEAAGAFEKGAAGAPGKFEVDATVTAVGQKQSFRLVSTGGQGFLTAGRRTQQVPATSFALDPRGWLKNPVDAGKAQVDGVTTDHVSADVDVSKMLTDLSAASAGSGAAAGQAGLTGEAQKSLRESLKSARAEIYTGTSDHILRRMTVTGTIAAANRVSSGAINGRLVFDLRITDVGKPQSIKAPVAAATKPAPKPTPKRHARPQRTAKPSPVQRSHRTAQGYVTCVQGANDLPALQRCQALAPRR